MPFDLFWFTRRYFAPFIHNLFSRVIEGKVFFPSFFHSFFFPFSFIRFRCYLNVLNRETTVNGLPEMRECLNSKVLCLYSRRKEMSDELERLKTRSDIVIDSKITENQEF